MPCVPMVMPSEMVMVLNSIGVPPASRNAFFERLGDAAQVMHVAGADLSPCVGGQYRMMGFVHDLPF